MVPTVRFTLRTGRSRCTWSPERSAPSDSWISVLSSAFSRPWSCARGLVARRRPAAAPACGRSGTGPAPRSSSAARRRRCPASRRARPPRRWCGSPAAARYSRTSCGDEPHEVDHVLGPPVEPLAQLRVLRGDADRAGVQVADPHHDAAGHHQRRGGEAELLGAEQRRDDDVAAGLELAVGLHHDPVAQAVGQQRLLGLGQPELPRPARVLDRGQRRGAGAAVVPGDQHDVGVRLGHARRDRADADLADQLHVDAGASGWRSSGRG